MMMAPETESRHKDTELLAFSVQNEDAWPTISKNVLRQCSAAGLGFASKRDKKRLQKINLLQSVAHARPKNSSRLSCTSQRSSPNFLIGSLCKSSNLAMMPVPPVLSSQTRKLKPCTDDLHRSTMLLGTINRPTSEFQKPSSD